MIMTLGIDLGKNNCSVAGLDESGTIVLRRRMQPKTILSFASKLAPCTIAMEACCGAHYLGRLLAGQGHEVRLMLPEYVRPYVKAQKNDDRDAEASPRRQHARRCASLSSNPRSNLMYNRFTGCVHDWSARTTLTNQLRAILLERGTVVPQGRRKLEQAVDALLADPDFMAGNRTRRLLAEMREEWIDLDRRIGALDQEFVELAHDDAATRRLASIPGIGVLNATALIAAVGDGSAFGRARDLGAWLRGLPARRHRNTVVVALSNKLARIAWATLRRGVTFEARQASPTT